MKKVIERIVESPGAPNENDLWLNGTTLKKFQNGEWVAISGGGSGSGDSSSSAPAVINVPGTFSGVRFVPELDASGKQEDTSRESVLWHEVADAFENGAMVNLVVDGNYYRVLSLESVNAGAGIIIQTFTVFRFSMYVATTTEQQSPFGVWYNPDSIPSPTPSDPAH